MCIILCITELFTVRHFNKYCKPEHKIYGTVFLKARDYILKDLNNGAINTTKWKVNGDMCSQMVFKNLLATGYMNDYRGLRQRLT